MSKEIILIESINPTVANLIVEDHRGTKSSYLSGIFMQAECVNGNGRTYDRNELSFAVNNINKKISEGYSVFGELNHPDNLNIDLNNVSHIITEMMMDGNNVMGKAKILNTPKGQIVKAIIEGGGRLGVSSRGAGNVNEGRVSSFQLTTVDVVANPSAPGAFPNHVMESLNQEKKIITLAEEVCHDEAAQKFFKKELYKFFEAMTGQQLGK